MTRDGIVCCKVTVAGYDQQAQDGIGQAPDGIGQAPGGGGQAQELELIAEHGENLLRLFGRSGVRINAPCGGNAHCGKCAVRILSGQAGLEEPSQQERALLNAGMLEGGYRLACFIKVDCDIVISLSSALSASAKILTSGFELSVPLDPYVRKHALILKEQTLLDQTPDAERVLRALEPHAAAPAGYIADDIGEYGITPFRFADIEILKKLAASDAAVTCVCAGSRVVDVERGDTDAACFGVAFDIGTTTIAGYLFNLQDGSQASVASALNPQARFGADVISRINHVSASRGGADELRDCVLAELNRLLSQLAARGGIGPDRIYAAFIVGNTTMLHLFMGLPAGRIAVSPFIPVTTGICMIPQRQSGICMAESGVAVCLPGVSAYVGADSVAASLSCDLDISDKVNVMIDLGTNGEIVIGKADSLYACSTAAGPAFEGASIRCGVGGVEGAIDSVRISPEGEVEYTTIGGAKAIGICGSGLVDLIAQLLKRQVIDETGRLLDAGEAEDAGIPPGLCGRLSPADEKNRAFRLLSASESSASDGIFLTQRDVRELQNAKAAIAAGTKTLLKAAGFRPEDVGRVYLAGGFGNYISVQSALDIGLVLGEFGGRIVPAGNAAGAGAAAALLSRQNMARMIKISKNIRYIELSSSPAFTDAYVDSMMFE